MSKRHVVATSRPRKALQKRRVLHPGSVGRSVAEHGNEPLVVLLVADRDANAAAHRPHREALVQQLVGEPLRLVDRYVEKVRLRGQWLVSRYRAGARRSAPAPRGSAARPAATAAPRLQALRTESRAGPDAAADSARPRRRGLRVRNPPLRRRGRTASRTSGARSRRPRSGRRQCPPHTRSTLRRRRAAARSEARRAPPSDCSAGSRSSAPGPRRRFPHPRPTPRSGTSDTSGRSRSRHDRPGRRTRA